MRSRWAAIGAAVAVTLGAGGLIAVDAAGPPSVFVAIGPTRVLDTRIGAGLAGVFTSGAPRLLDVTGTVPVVEPGDAVTTGAPVPDGATAIVANVTAVFPTTAGFVAVRPGTATGNPATSNINFTSGGVVAPNSVTVELPTSGLAAGNIQLWFQGTAGTATTHLLVDIVGYYQVGPTGPQGEQGPQGATGPRGVGFRTDCANDSMGVWNATTLAWECRLDLRARGTASSGLQGYGARISSDLFRGMIVQGAAGWYDAYFGGDSGISTNGLIDRSGAARILAVNSGTTTIEPGDLVAIVGISTSVDGQPILAVELVDATNADAIVGVAEGAVSANSITGAGGVEYVDFAPDSGNVDPGSHVVVVTGGLAPAVNVASLALVTDVPIGAKLALSASGEMEARGDGTPGVVVGIVVGPLDEESRTIPMFIDIG